LDRDELSNPARWNAVIGGFDFDTSIQMHGPFAELVIAEWFDRQRKQQRFFFGEHRRHLSLRRAVNARIGPAGFPVIQIRLGFFKTLEAKAFQRSFLCVADARFDLSFAIGVLNRHGIATTP
jgi:hypothetical protein